MEAFYIILGLIVLYTTGHLFILQSKAYADRTTYEKVVTWVAIVSIILEYISIMIG